MPVVQIGWDKIKARLDDVTAIYTLTHRQASLLLSLTEQLDWEKTFRTDDYDFSDIDDLQLEIDDLRLYLTMPVSLQDLIGYIDEVETLLEAIRDIDRTVSSGCCDGTGPITETNSTDLDQTDSGDTPAEYGEETVADFDDWRDLICGSAHSYVDLLKETNNELNDIVKYAAIGVGAVAGLMALLSGAGVLLVIGYGAAASLVSGLIAGAVAGTFEGIDEDLETARLEIICAIMNGTGEDLSDAVENAVSATAWNLWFNFIDFESAHATLITGENSNGFLTPVRGLNCDCQDPYEYCPNYDWKVSGSGWTFGGEVGWLAGVGTGGEGIFHVGDQEYPTSYNHCRSDDFSFPGGRVDWKCRAKSSTSGTPSVQNTYIVIRLHRASDDAIMETIASTHEGQDVWSIVSDLGDTTEHAATDYYLTIAWDGVDGYARYVDYISMRPHGL